ncbi:hypothetical protein [Rhizobium sp. R635]|uniref:hypothetical protein n=1 Tax=Rhizobium sp. R635 TaxID=1764275 RepID=UPI00113213AB|nr:hypothetical protein [Rhizobium sp. R635]
MTRFLSLLMTLISIGTLVACTSIVAEPTNTRSKVIYAKDGRTRFVTKNAPHGTTAGTISDPQLYLVEERTGGGRTTLHWFFSYTYDNRRGTHGFSKNSSHHSQRLYVTIWKDIAAPGRDRRLKTVSTQIQRGRCWRIRSDEEGIFPSNFFDQMDYFTLSWDPRFIWAKNACP